MISTKSLEVDLFRAPKQKSKNVPKNISLRTNIHPWMHCFHFTNSNGGFKTNTFPKSRMQNRWISSSAKFFKNNLPRVLSLPPVSAHSQNLSNSDENIDGIHVDSNTSVDRIKRRYSISDGVSLRLVYDLLCIVKKKSSEQD